MKGEKDEIRGRKKKGRKERLDKKNIQSNTESLFTE